MTDRLVEFLRGMAEHIADTITVRDRDGQVCFANPVVDGRTQ